MNGSGGNDNLFHTFLQEATELLQNVEQAVLEVEATPDDNEALNGLFRVFHTLKGAAGAAGFPEIEALSHRVESVLDRVRKKVTPVSKEIVDLVLSASDLTGQMVAQLSGGPPPDPVLRGRVDDAIADLSPQREVAAAPTKQILHLFADEPDPAPPATDEGSTALPLAAADASGAVPVDEGQREQNSGSSRANAAPPASIVRVSSDKIDRLIKLVGELVINQSRLTQAMSQGDLTDMAEPVEALERLVVELRDGVLGVRMTPIGGTFGRFRRLVRDLADELGKHVELVTEGEETELDKSVIDRLSEPLMHLVRNSVDHGLERPEARALRGKPATGTVRLSAQHEGAHVVITIEDDGNGLDTDAIRAKAIERGLIGPTDQLSQTALHELIFAPGFSTAAQVTNVSGRGVGMDVVKRRIEALNGTVTLSTEPGRGTCIQLTLPLTLAIIDGLLVAVGSERLIIPMSAVRENVELLRTERARHNGRNAIVVRGAMVPFICLSELFDIESEANFAQKVVIIEHHRQRLGLAVDRVLGNHQTVIQSLGHHAQKVKVVSGATILGDGRVALIVNLAGVVDLFERNAAAERHGQGGWDQAVGPTA